jgi:hypothetical protein
LLLINKDAESATVVMARIALLDHATDVLQVPVAALFRRGGEWAVFHVNDNRAKLTRVDVGRNNGRNAQILSGIEAGESVVLYPGEQVEDGARATSPNVEVNRPWNGLLQSANSPVRGL